MYNLYHYIANNQARCQRFTCGESLFTIYNCRLKNRFEDLWSHHNYIIYVTEGRKIWHTSAGSYDLQPGTCVFVRKGAVIAEQFFDTEFCFLLHFVPDEFIYDILRQKTKPLSGSGKAHEPVIRIETNAIVDTYFQSMMNHFDSSHEPDTALLEVKFRELILLIADNPGNQELRSYFGSLLQFPNTVSLLRVMEENFCFNLKLEEFAKLCARSLSAFKRDFQKQFNTTPGRWLLEKRLEHAMHLLSNLHKTVGEAAFESGFEDASHFSRCFRQRFGILPTAVRHQMIA